MRIYDKATRRKLRKRIRELITEGRSRAEVAAVLNKEGFQSPSGTEITANLVSSQCHNMGVRKHRRMSVRKNKPAADDTIVLMEIILEANISAERKIAMIRGINFKKELPI